MCKVLLCIVPDYEYDFPPLGTPALTAFLKKKGIAAVQTDFNLKYRDFLNRRISGLPVSLKENSFFLNNALKEFFTGKLRGRYYSGFFPRDTDAVFPFLPYDNNTNSSFYFTERLLSSPYLFRYLQDENENTFYQFYKEEDIVGKLEKENIGFVGISIISPSQAIAGFTLGLLIKKNLPKVYVNIGGQWPTLYRDNLRKKKDFFDCYDSIVVFEGETALYNLVTNYKTNNAKLRFLPNVIVKESRGDIEKERIEEDMDSLPCPDFDGLELSRYSGNQGKSNSLTYETSRGCYWSKCAYCVDLPLPKPAYRRKHPRLVVQDIKKLKEKYNAGNLLLSDPGVSPRQMLAISRGIIAEGISLDWWCMARLDNGFSREVFETAAKAGLKKINFGFESASDRVCGLLHKGNTQKQSARVIRDCHQAGIAVDLQTILGLPNETFNDGLETISFLIENRSFISHVTFNIYYLTPANYVSLQPEKFGIEYDLDDSLPFGFFVPFRNLKGMTKEEAYLLQKIYYSLLHKGSVPNNNYFYDGVSLSTDVSEGSMEFGLCGEKCRVGYLYNKKTQAYLFMTEKEQNILDLIKKGFKLENKGQDFIAQGVRAGFLVEKRLDYESAR